MAENKTTIGITMRVVSASAYDEPRDALAHDWYVYLDWLLGDEVQWLLIPNLGADAVKDYARQHQIDALILSGGNDIGDCPIRDDTEEALIEYALAKNLPLIGICRGLQLLWHFFGGVLQSVDAEKHVANRHQLLPSDDFLPLLGQSGRFEVNSFHHHGLCPDSPPAELAVMARTQDNQIEAVMHRRANILGVMWHPEREVPFSEIDRKLLRTILLGENN